MPRKETDRLLRSLPYELTSAQMRVWKEIMQDMQGEYVMSRLVQGDVGSGKTIIAFLAMLLAACNGYQAALMVPTEVLAKQHFKEMEKLLKEHQLPLKAFSLPVPIQQRKSGRDMRKLLPERQSLLSEPMR